MPKFDIKQIRFVGDALWDKCHAEGAGFEIAAKVMRGIGSEQEAAIFEERSQLLKGLKPISFEELASRPNQAFFVKESSR